MKSSLYDRLFAVALLALSGLVAWAASQFDVAFQYEPLGPKAFPWILSGLLATSAIWLFIKPDKNEWQPPKLMLAKLGGALVLMWVYASLYEPVGFIISTTLVGGVFSWLFGEKPLNAAIYALSMSVISYFLFSAALDLNVPTGSIFGG